MERVKSWVCIAALVLTFCAGAAVGAAQPDGDQRQGATDVMMVSGLQQGCLAAAIVAIDLEIQRHERWIEVRQQQGDSQGLKVLRESLAALKADREKYAAMDADHYVLPERMTVTGWVEGKAGRDAILYVEGMSKSGPWYHLAGIRGDEYAALQAGQKYSLDIYAVYKRSYGSMHSAYVYVDGPRQQALGKRITGEVFAHVNLVLLNEPVKCDRYQIYLLKEARPGAKGELILDSRQSAFDITLTAKQLAEYRYLEVVAEEGTQLVRIDTLQEERLNIFLERGLGIKKPAIYLYADNVKVTVTHQFQGRVLTTYPAYGDGWTVIADRDGRLLNLKDGRTYRYLYWDGVHAFPREHYRYDTGFIVQRPEYAAFLESKLRIIGLNSDEINDFIVYWLPIMNRYASSFVHFRLNDDIGGSSILTTEPRADTTIRLFMEFCGLDDVSSPPKVPEQALPSFARKGFTLVEWGGAEIGQDKFE